MTSFFRNFNLRKKSFYSTLQSGFSIKPINRNLSFNITVYNFLVWKGVISISSSETHSTDLKMCNKLFGRNKRILSQNKRKHISEPLDKKIFLGSMPTGPKPHGLW